MRNCYLDRWWDKLHYLLPGKRRGGPVSVADELVDKTFRGGEPIAEHARVPQGQPGRVVTPGEVDGIAALLGPLTVDRLRTHHSPQGMESAGVYKFVAGRDDRDWEYLPQYFGAFQRFYQVDKTPSGRLVGGVLAFCPFDSPGCGYGPAGACQRPFQPMYRSFKN